MEKVGCQHTFDDGICVTMMSLPKKMVITETVREPGTSATFPHFGNYPLTGRDLNTLSSSRKNLTETVMWNFACFSSLLMFGYLYGNSLKDISDCMWLIREKERFCNSECKEQES